MTRGAVLLAALVAGAPAGAAQTAPTRPAPVLAGWAAAPAGPLAYRLPGWPLRSDLGRPADGSMRAGPGARADSLRPPDAWLGRDKALHAGGSFLLALSARAALAGPAGLPDGGALPVSAALVLGVGLAKEVADSRRAVGPHFSWRDLAADALGVALASAVGSL